ncbi:T9SS type A sorting domain-containing protein [Bacteroidota bacterium]
MRKSILFYSFLCFLLAGMMFTIQAQDSNGKAPQIVKSNSSNWTSEPTSPDATVGYAHSTSNSQMVSLPLPGGTPLTVIGAQAYTDFCGGGVFGGDGQFYTSTVGDVSGTPQIWTQNITTGAATLVGNTGTSAAEGFNGIAFDHSTGTYYGASGANLYTFDNTTGTATLVGPLNNTGGLAIDIAVDCLGNMYMHDLGLDAIFSVDKSTGNATLIGSTGFDANFGQGMGYDHDSGTLYLFAFNNATFTAQLMTVDVTTGLATMVADYGLDQHTAFDGIAGCGPPCPVGQATNPNPPTGATGIPITGNTASWTNGAGATSIEVFFNGASVYSGAPITSLSLAGVEPFNYSTTYNWRVDGSDGSCTTAGATWTFTTVDDPNIFCAWMDDFEDMTLTNWTVTNNGGTCDWLPILLSSRTYTMPATASGWGMSADSDLCGSGTTINSTSTMNVGVDATQGPGYNTFFIEFDHDFRTIDLDDDAIVEVSLDGGTTWTEVVSWIGVDARNEHYVSAGFATGLATDIRFRCISVQPGWDWWWAIDNFAIYLTDPVPVELTSFAASVNDGNVTLNWSTSTETNNQGFEVQRSTDNEFTTIGFVDGSGTTTENHTYSYVDASLEAGTYTYRLKQIDYDGTSEYSESVEVEVIAPDVFALEQNYPNPFNPSTMIKFSLAADSKVSLTVFDVLGQEVANLLSGDLAAGSHEVNFNASNVNSGVYFYRIDATAVDGTNFTSVKKMILTK